MTRGALPFRSRFRRAIALLGIVALLSGCVFRRDAESWPVSSAGAAPTGAAAASPGAWPARYDAPFTSDVCAEPWWALDAPVSDADFGLVIHGGELVPAAFTTGELRGRGPGRMLIASVNPELVKPLRTSSGTLAPAAFIAACSWHRTPAPDAEAPDVVIDLPPGATIRGRSAARSPTPSPSLPLHAAPGAPGARSGWTANASVVTSFVRVAAIQSSTASTSAALLLPKREPVGTVLYLASAVGLIFDEDVVGALVTRGWAVVLVFPPRGGLTADSRWRREFSFDIDQWLSDDHRVRRQVPLEQRPRLIEPRHMAETLGAAATQFYSEWGYAADAALEHFAPRLPSRDQRPFVMFGASLGAIALPAVAARLERRPDAAIFLAGGVNFPRIIYRGLANLRAVSDHRAYWDEVERLYPAHSPLDGENAAARLRGVPILQIHALFDAIVPSSAGRMLWERLGRPERWDIPLGHGGAFFMTGLWAGSVVDWLEKATAQGPDSGGTTLISGQTR